MSGYQHEGVEPASRASRAQLAAPAVQPSSQSYPLSRSGVLGLQRAVGNRCTRQVLAVQRDGWTGVDPRSPNFARQVVPGENGAGGVLRIPIEGISAGHATSDAGVRTNRLTRRDQRTGRDVSVPAVPVRDVTPETPGTGTAGRAIVLVPQALPAGLAEVEILFHLHGHNIGYRGRGPHGQGAPRDTERDRIEQQLSASRRPMIAILPQGGFASDFGRSGHAVNVGTYIDQVFALIPPSAWPPGPVPRRGDVVLSGHSGAGEPLSTMLRAGPAMLPVRIEGLFLFDAINDDRVEGEYGAVRDWLHRQFLRDLRQLRTELQPVEWLQQRAFRFRGVYTGGGYERRYRALADEIQGWLNLAADRRQLGGRGSALFRAMRDNYRIVPAGQVDHEHMLGGRTDRATGARRDENLGAALSQLPVAQRSSEPLPSATRSELEGRLGHPFGHVRVHPDSPEADRAGAEAYTRGADIVFAPGAYAPGTAAGDRLLTHELVHVAQHAGTAGTESDALSDPEGLAEAEARRAETGDHVVITPAPRLVHRRPRELVSLTFLGRPVQGGVNPGLRNRLAAVERHLRAVFAALPPALRTDPETGQLVSTFEQWGGVTTVRGWRPSRSLHLSKHQSGSAVDVNYDRQPYIATRGPGERGGTVYGGEAAGAALQRERRSATEVYDRAMAFRYPSGLTADVGELHRGETTGQAYDRFRMTSDALRDYFRFAFVVPPGGAPDVNRRPIRNIEIASESTLLASIPEGERRPQAEAEALLAERMSGFFWQFVHPDWPFDVHGTYIRMLRDYEHVRIPMVKNDPVARPQLTRSPVNGFLHMRRELVEAMRDVGHLRWGAVDFGQEFNGDVHHFDLRDHGGVVPDGTP